MDELWGLYCEYFGEKWPRYSDGSRPLPWCYNTVQSNILHVVKHIDGKFVRVTALVVTEDVEACLQHPQWWQGQSPWQPQPFLLRVNDKCRTQIWLWLQNRHPYLTITGELWGVSNEYFGEKWLCHNKTKQHDVETKYLSILTNHTVQWYRSMLTNVKKWDQSSWFTWYINTGTNVIMVICT